MEEKKEILKQQIQNIIDYASINAGNDVILAQYTDDILEIFTQLSAEKDRKLKERVEKEFYNKEGKEICMFLKDFKKLYEK